MSLTMTLAGGKFTELCAMALRKRPGTKRMRRKLSYTGMEGMGQPIQSCRALEREVPNMGRRGGDRV